VPAVDSVVFFESTTELKRLFLVDTQADKQRTMRVVCFWQKNCPCDQFTKPHFLLLINQYRHLSHNIIFYLAPVDNSEASHDLLDVEQLPTI
jgi:hypothetical protein